MSQRRRKDIASFTKSRGAPFRRPLRWLYILSPILAAAALLGAWLGKGEVLFSSGPLSPGHAVFANDCQQCHSRPFAKLRGRGQAPLAKNRDCLRCHQQSLGYSAATQTATHHERVPGDGRPCATCHVEHRGRPLTLIDDEPCLSCHKNLRAKQAEVEVADRISGFAGDGAASGGNKNLHPEFRWLAEKRPDPGVLKFNHRRHLFGSGLLGPDGRPVSLQCQDCHRPAGLDLPWRFGAESGPRAGATANALPRGEHMAPIAYSSHCAACHPLKLPEPSAELRGDAAIARGEVPHAAPAAIRSYLRGQLAILPRTFAALEQEVRTVEGILYQADGVSGAVCTKCHTLKTAEIDPDDVPLVVPTAIPSRFLPRARFSHAKHTAASMGSYKEVGLAAGTADCLACHARAVDSTRTSDILIPSIQDCLRCHGPASGYRASARGGAAARCTTCHTYHVPPPQAQGPTPIAEDAPEHTPLPSLVAAGRREVRSGLANSTPLWPMSAFFALPARVWGLPDVRPGSERFLNEVFARYGLYPADTLNDGLPLGLIKTERTWKGESGIIVTCEICHTSSLFGKIVVGQPNPFADIEQLWIDLGRASNELGQDPLYAKTPAGNTVVNGADHLGLLGLYYRNPDYSANVSKAMRWLFSANLKDRPATMKAEFDALAYLKTPPWYNYATRKSGACGLYADGGQPKYGNFAAFTYLLTFRDFDGQDLATALAAWKRSAPAFLGSLPPPSYPFSIRTELLPQGRATYAAHCARCHGSYAAGASTPDALSYPGLVIPLEDIKTDPKRAHFPPLLHGAGAGDTQRAVHDHRGLRGAAPVGNLGARSLSAQWLGADAAGAARSAESAAPVRARGQSEQGRRL